MTGDRYVLDQPTQHLAIPTTLQASLMARVDRLGSAREVLQIGAAIGREFSYDVLAAVAGLPDAVLQDALIRLTEAELVFLRGTPPNAIYTFKHALVQDAAYSTMLRTRRQQLACRHRAGAGEALSGHRQHDAGSDRAAIRAGRTKRKSHPILAAGRRPRSAPLRHEGIDRALFQCAASRHGHAGNAERSDAGTRCLPRAWLGAADRDRPDRQGAGAQLPARAGAQPRAAGPRARTLSRHLGHLVLCDDDGPHRRGVSALPTTCSTIARELDNSGLLVEAYHARGPDCTAAAGSCWHKGSRGGSHPALRPRTSSRPCLLFRRARFPRLRAKLLCAQPVGPRLSRSGRADGVAMHRGRPRPRATPFRSPMA